MPDDALDECEENSRQTFLTGLKKLFSTPRPIERSVAKFIVTSRPSGDILESFSDISPKVHNLRVDSSSVSADPVKFIDARVDELSKLKRYGPKQKASIKDALTEKAGGTFM